MTETLISRTLTLRRALVIGSQLLMVVAANRAAFELRFDGAIPQWALLTWWETLPWLIAIRGLIFIPFRLYEGLWRYTSIYDLRAILGAVTVSSVVFTGVMMGPLTPPDYPSSVYIIDALLLTLFLGGIRLTRRLYSEVSNRGRSKRVLVFGAGDAAELIVRDMKTTGRSGYMPIGFIDDDTSKVGRRIHGVPVLGTRHDLVRILHQHNPDEVLIAIPGADSANMRSIVRSLEPFKVPIKTLPKLRDVIDGKVKLGHIRSLAVEDLLARAPVGLDPVPVRHLIRGRRVMVTGAGGSIGSELCRQLAQLQPASLVLFDRSENGLHAIGLELQDQHHSCGVASVVGDVCDAACVSSTLQKYQPEVIFHAAAHKHVPLMEDNPCEAIKNNVRGTRLLARAAEFHGVDRFILISTDKAVNPTSVMGASKRLAEMAVQTQALGSGTSFAIVRFGNVLGSNGSVVLRFMDQIKQGGPVTITDPDVRRFFMRISEAVQLVLQAAAQAGSGAIYVLEVGEQVKLLDMARDLIRLSGLVPEEDIRIEFIGLRPGEKLHEELVGAMEEATQSAVEKILKVIDRRVPEADFFVRLEALEADAAKGDAAAVIEALRALVPEYSNSELPEHSNGAVASAAPDSRVLGAPDFPGHGTSQHCPGCRSTQVHRSKSRHVIERIRRGVTPERLFRCDECGWRGWLVPLVCIEGGNAVAAKNPDLARLDRAVVSNPMAGRVTFSPRNLR